MAPIARPAIDVEPKAPIEPSTYVPDADDELPPPFFADGDEAFLDMSETPPPLPKPIDLEARITQALSNLPPFPESDSPDRSARLLQILRTLDRIAGDVCNVLESARENSEPLPAALKSR